LGDISLIRIASNILNAPAPVASADCSGVFQLSLTND